MADVVRRIFSLLFTTCVIFSVTVGQRFGYPAKTLHIAKRNAVDNADRGMFTIQVPKDAMNQPEKMLRREVRSINNPSSTAPNITSVVSSLFCSLT